MDENEAFASFWGHIEDLRCTLLRILFMILSAAFICFLCYQPLFSLLKKPLTALTPEFFQEERLEYIRVNNSEKIAKTIILPKKSLISKELSIFVNLIEENTYQVLPGGSLVYAKPITYPDLVVLGPLEGILISLKASLYIGIFTSSPLWLLFLAQFFLPGLRYHERRLILPFIVTSISFVLLGCLFAYFVTIPMANQSLIIFNQGIGTNLWSLGNYLDYTLFLLMANGLAFELGVMGIFAVHLQYLSEEGLKANRRFAILGAFLIAAILTPPDVLTQFLLAIPLIGLYEALILFARMQKKVKSIKF